MIRQARGPGSEAARFDRDHSWISRARLSLIPAITLALLLAVPFAAGCGGGEAQTAASGSTGPQTAAYSTSPQSTSKLLKDASDAIRAMYPSNQGVRFQMDAIGTSGSQLASVRAEGEIAFPDRLRMTSRDFPAEEPSEVEVIVIAGKAYSKSAATGNVWQGGPAGTQPPDPQHLAAYLDYTRSSHNFGQETLAGGRKTWHIQMDVDMAMLSTDELRGTADPDKAAELEAQKSAVLTADYWIGIDDLLPYQATIMSSNKVSGQNQEQNLIFSGWGERFEIVKPCEDC